MLLVSVTDSVWTYSANEGFLSVSSSHSEIQYGCPIRRKAAFLLVHAELLLDADRFPAREDRF